MKYIIDIKGEIEGDYEIIGKYEERPQGEWIDHENHIECNKCQVWFLKDHLIRKSFCPNCGARCRKAVRNEDIEEQRLPKDD